MSTNTFFYTANSMVQQTICTFDVPREKLINYRIHQLTELGEIVSNVQVTHDGIVAYETQTGFSYSNTSPDEITATITNNVGSITVTPSVVPTTYTIEANFIEANLYSEHTKSGRLIKGVEGFSIVWSNNANNFTCRESNNNQFGNSSLYFTGDFKLGPVHVDPELFDANNLIEYEGSQLISNDTFIIVASSNSTRNCCYIELDVEQGEMYTFTANAYYTLNDVYGKDINNTQHILPHINIGDSIAGDSILRLDVTDIDTNHTSDFVAESNTVIISLGMGSFGTNLNIHNITCKKVVPMFTFKQQIGSFYFNFPVVAAGSNLLVFGNNTIKVDVSNNITLNDIILGTQTANSKLSFYYSNNQTAVYYNGSASNTIVYQPGVTSLVFTSTPNEFSYTNEQLSNTVLIELTND